MFTIATSSRWTVGLALAVACSLGTATAQVQLTVGVWNEKGEPVTDAVVSTFDASGVAFKALNVGGGEYLLFNPGAPIAHGTKAELVVDTAGSGSVSYDLRFIPVLDPRVDVVFESYGVAYALSPDLQPELTQPGNGPPANDDCANAISVGTTSVTPGSTEGATLDAAGTCVTGNDTPGVWYSVVGNNTELTAATCGAFFGYDTKVSVYSGSCDSLACVTGNDDNCVGGASGLLSSATWCAQSGVTYFVLVHGFGGATGPFDLTVSSGITCSGPPSSQP